VKFNPTETKPMRRKSKVFAFASALLLCAVPATFAQDARSARHSEIARLLMS
jgi:hypothetical protein